MLYAYQLSSRLTALSTRRIECLVGIRKISVYIGKSDDSRFKHTNPMLHWFKYVLTLFGPVYFGFQQNPVWLVAAWAAFSAAWFFWDNRHVLRLAREHAQGADATPSAWM